jgi:tetratricopeptide (TPR) repeat protein
VGGLRHPSADSARKLWTERKFSEAEDTIEQALDNQPGHPDLVCERALLRVMKGRESEAIELIPLANNGFRFKRLCQLLVNHLSCRLSLDPSDHRAQKQLEILRSFNVKPSKDVGIQLTACLIARNEEANLERCLTSLTGLVTEIVVVDTGSTDATEAIAKRYGAVIGHFEWCDDFSAARNAALELATGNWILWIDADEELDPNSIAALRRAIVRPQFGGFDIEIVNFTNDHSPHERFQHCPTRLFRKVEGVEFTGRIHEQITPSLVKLGLPWARLEGARILHYGYRPEEMERKSKLERTTSMLEREVRDSPEDAFQWFNLANAYLVGGRWFEAEHASRQAASFMPADAPFGENCYVVWAQAAMGANRPQAAVTICEEGVERGHSGPFLLFEHCEALLAANRPQEALEVSDLLLASEPPEGSAGDSGIFGHKRKVLRGQILAVLGRFQEALDLLDDALSVDPDFAAALYSRGAVLEKLGRLSDALVSFSRAAWDSRSFGPAMKGCGRALAGIGRTVEAATAFRKAWERSPEDLEAWIGWTGACEATGDIHSVLEAYEAFSKVHEPSPEILINWGRTLEAAGQVDRALSCFSEAINRDPMCSNAYFNCGDLLYRVGALSDAAHLYEAGLQIVPGYADGWFTLGNALAKAGLPAQAIVAYESALKCNPRHDGAIHNLNVVSTEKMSMS